MSNITKDVADAPVETDNDAWIYEYGSVMTDGYGRYASAEQTEFEYLYIPIITGLSIISSIIISCIFLKKSIISPTTILLVGLTLARSMRSFIQSGIHIYSYFVYSKDVLYYLPYPFCFIRHILGEFNKICDTFALCCVFVVAFQRLLVVKWPFEGRRFLTNRTSLLVLLVSGVISIGYNLPEFFSRVTTFSTFKTYVEGKGLDVDNYISYEYYYYTYYTYYNEIETSTNYDITTNAIYDVTTILPLDSFNLENGTHPSLLQPLGTTSPSYEFEELIITDSQREELYNECVYKQATTIGRAKRLYHVIFYVVYLFSIAAMTIYLIILLKHRNLSDSRHEAKGSVRKMTLLNISVLMLLAMEFLRGVLFYSILFISYLAYIGVYQLPSSREGLETFIVLFRVRDIVVTFSSFLTLWIYIVSCRRFRQELFKIFVCAFCRTKKSSAVITKEPKQS